MNQCQSICYEPVIDAIQEIQLVIRKVEIKNGSFKGHPIPSITNNIRILTVFKLNLAS